MSGRPVISAYTPSNTDPELLKRIFVQREKLLDRIVDRLSRSMTTGDKHHLLLIGPRGSGKTHLVSLAAWELQQRDDPGDVMRIAWLGEDDSFTGLIHLAFGIARQLAQEYPDEFPEDFKTPVRGLDQDDAALAVLNNVVEQLQNRNLILITENLDQTFRGLGDTGQKKWRAFLQETKRIATLATSQQLFAGVSDRKEAFFGFFDIQHLKPLTVDDASELIRRISVEQNKPELASYLNSAEGRYRIRALHHLAGGNHRMYVLLAEFLTKDSLDDLVAAFENLAHDMTPYFQERLRSLPDQQKQLVQCLCDAEGALTVKEVAEETFIPERNCSKQLGNLKSRGYVQSERRGKESYYDMAEPLMRLCLEVKNQRGRPLKMVARFLKAWFPTTVLDDPESNRARSPRVQEYCIEALQAGNGFEATIASHLQSEIRENISAGRFEVAKNLIEELQVTDRDSALWAEAELAERQADYHTAVACLTKLIDADSIDAGQRAKALIRRGFAFGELGDVDLERADYSAVVEMHDAPANQRAWAMFTRGLVHRGEGETNLELADYSAVIDMNDAPADLRAKALYNRGVAHYEQGQTDLALADYSAVIGMDDAPTDQRAWALVNRGVIHSGEGETVLALADYSSVIDMDDAPAEQRANALFNRGVFYWRVEDFGASEAEFKAMLNLDGVSAEWRTNALFAAPEPMIDHCTRGEVLKALKTAFEEGDRQTEKYGGTPRDLLWMILRRGPVEWADYIADIAPLYIDHGVADKLGRGITQSIAQLDSGDYSHSQLDLWNSAWQKAGRDCEALELPLRCLDAAVQVMKSDPATDRPLFQLPLEIRQLVRPLLNTTLGPPEEQ